MKEKIFAGGYGRGDTYYASCGGNATCGKCKIKVIGGSHFTDACQVVRPEYADGYRLACLTSYPLLWISKFLWNRR